MKDIAGQALRVDAHHDVESVADFASHQRDVGLAVKRALEGHDLEVAELGRQPRLGHLAHEPFRAHAVVDQVGDGHQQQAVAPGEPGQFGHPRHRAVLAHDLADHAGGIEPRQPCQIHGCLGVTRPHEHAALACPERKHVSGPQQVLWLGLRRDRRQHRRCAIGGRDAGAGLAAGVNGHARLRSLESTSSWALRAGSRARRAARASAPGTPGRGHG